MENLPVERTKEVDVQASENIEPVGSSADTLQKKDTMISNDRLWNDIQEHIQSSLGMQRYSIWFKRAALLNIDGDTLTVGVPNRLILEYLVTRYSDGVMAAASEIMGRPVNVRFEIAPQLAGQMLTEREQPRPAETDCAKARLLKFRPFEAALRTSNAFMPYAVGEHNRMAHAAVCELLKGRRQGFRFLWIHGDHGSGKTALLDFARREIQAEQPQLRVQQCTAEAWTNEFFCSLQNSQVSKFRHRYRNCDVLLIDDVHFLNHKNTPQEELLHTLKTLLPLGKTVVLTGVRNFRESRGYLPALFEQLQASLTIGLAPLTQADRRQLLKEVAAYKEVPCTEEVLDELADGRYTSVRELINGLDVIAAYADIHRIGHIDATVAEEALAAMHQSCKRKLTIESIEKAVLKRFHLTHAALAGQSRRREVAWPRQVAMFLVGKYTDSTLTAIGRYFGGRNHSTVKHAIDRVRKAAESDPAAAELLQTIMNLLDED